MAADLHPEARAELRLSAIWYDERRPGLGDEFVSEVMLTLHPPNAGPVDFTARSASAGDHSDAALARVCCALPIVHAERDENIRIISARLATRKERHDYEAG